MKRKHRIAAISASTLGASILFGGALAPEAAATPTCPGAFCVWPGVGYTGTPATTLSSTDFDTICTAIYATLSAVNDLGQTVSLYNSSGIKIVTLLHGANVHNTGSAARYACLGDEASMNHNETVLLS